MKTDDKETSKDAIQHLPLNTDALDTLLQSWYSEFPHVGVLALLPEQEKDNLHILQACCRNQRIPLAGAIFPATLFENKLHYEGVLLFRFDERIPSFLIPQLSEDQSTLDGKIAQTIKPAIETVSTSTVRPSLYMIFDGLLPNIASILDGLYLRLSDRVTYAGVNAGSESFQSIPCLFDGDRVISGGVLCLLLPGHDITVLAHGYPTPKNVMYATSTDGNRILNIDWNPAFDVYQEIIKQEYGVNLNKDNFYHYAVHFPFGILRANQDVVVRIPVTLNDDGSLYCIGEVPENAILVLLRAPKANEGHCIDHLADGLERNNGPLKGRSMLIFYCAGRHMHLEESSLQELSELSEKTGVRHLAGALSLGEIGSTGEWEYPMFHNASLVCTPWGSN